MVEEIWTLRKLWKGKNEAVQPRKKNGVQGDMKLTACFWFRQRIDDTVRLNLLS